MADTRLDQTIPWDIKRGIQEGPQGTDPDGPFDYGYLAWNYSPFMQTVTGTAIATTNIAFCRVKIPGDTLITNVIYNRVTAATSATTGQCFIGIYSAAGALLGQTADCAATWNAAAALDTRPLTTPLAVSGTTNPYIYVGFQFNGTTGPAIGAITAGQSTNAPTPNGKLAAPTFKWGVSVAGAGTTALPATMGANVAVTASAIAAAYWVALT